MFSFFKPNDSGRRVSKWVIFSGLLLQVNANFTCFIKNSSIYGLAYNAIPDALNLLEKNCGVVPFKPCDDFWWTAYKYDASFGNSFYRFPTCTLTYFYNKRNEVDACIDRTLNENCPNGFGFDVGSWWDKSITGCISGVTVLSCAVAICCLSKQRKLTPRRNVNARINQNAGQLELAPEHGPLIPEQGIAEHKFAANAHSLTLFAAPPFPAAAPEGAPRKDFKKYICSITLKIMRDPYEASDGNPYEREALLQWLQQKRISPLTNKELKETDEYILNHDGSRSLRQKIHKAVLNNLEMAIQYIQDHPEVIENPQLEGEIDFAAKFIEKYHDLLKQPEEIKQPEAQIQMRCA